MLSIIQTRKSYKSIEIDFINPFKISIYENIYIYNLVDYFSRYVYPYPTVDTNITNVILLFNHYLQANPKFYIVYIDVNLQFTS